jgi:hypothetical protein
MDAFILFLSASIFHPFTRIDLCQAGFAPNHTPSAVLPVQTLFEARNHGRIYP